MKRKLRGQGTVELALGLTLLVPVLMLGWSFAEAGFASMKVTEAAESALWDGTSMQSAGALADFAADAQARYADFDGRTGTNRLAGRTGAGTRSSGLHVTCGATGGATIRPTALLASVLPPPSTAGCSARAETRLFAGFTLPHCSSGRPEGLLGPCTGRQVLALDEGNLRDSNICTVQKGGGPCENGEYFAKVQQLYRDTGAAQGRAALELVRETLDGELPLHAGTSLDFYLSFQGEDSAAGPFAQAVPKVADGEEPKWTTTPFEYHPEYAASHGARTRCFLGADCDSTSIDKP